jgi:endonuclease YncB( thermonuclease family)
MTHISLRTIRSIRHAALVLSLAGAAVHASTITGEVVGISDGDTLTVLDASLTQHKIRLSGIDAPEKKQPFGERSRQNLADMVFRKQVTVDWNKTDRYGRIVGKVLAGKQDVCIEQLRAGLAWHYKAFEREQPILDRISYARAEEEARRSRRGLWREPDPTPPWDYRHSRRH